MLTSIIAIAAGLAFAYYLPSLRRNLNAAHQLCKDHTEWSLGN